MTPAFADAERYEQLWHVPPHVCRRSLPARLQDQLRETRSVAS